ncbi:MAG TPA: LysE family translocator, partial [Burkholderiaceae bacterium]|nr:LysE family translocator [Burkholderiaceae bacterium]
MLEVSWFLFIVASLVLIITPGQDMILVMSRSVAQGAAAGVVTAAGVSVGLVGHTLLATLGLGAVLRTSEWLFLALKLVGAAYLIYLGVGLLRTKNTGLVVQSASHRSLGRLFFDGALSNVSNPKIAVFYFA